MVLLIEIKIKNIFTPFRYKKWVVQGLYRVKDVRNQRRKRNRKKTKGEAVLAIIANFVFFKFFYYNQNLKKKTCTNPYRTVVVYKYFIQTVSWGSLALCNPFEDIDYGSQSTDLSSNIS